MGVPTPGFDSISAVKSRTGNGALNWTHNPVGTAKAILVFAGNMSSGGILTAASGTSMNYGGIALTQLPNCSAIHNQQAGGWWFANNIEGRANNTVSTTLSWYNYGYLFHLCSVIIDSGGLALTVREQANLSHANAMTRAAVVSADSPQLYVFWGGGQGIGKVDFHTSGAKATNRLGVYVDSQRTWGVGTAQPVENGDVFGAGDMGPNNGAGFLGLSVPNPAGKRQALIIT